MITRIDLKGPTEPVIALDQIPEAIYSVKLSQHQRERLSMGEQVFLENMELPGGRIVDGKINYIISQGEPHLKFLEKKPTLEIPNEIAGQKLDEKDKDLLKAEQILPLKTKNGLLFIQLDKDLNRVVVKTEREIGVPKEIGGYTLTDKDKELFVNNKPLPTRVYHNPETNSYFLATLRKTEDGKGMEVSNHKPIHPDQALQMIEKYNREDRSLKDAVEIVNTFKAEEQKPTILKTYTEEKEHIFEKHVEQRNFSAVKDMTDKGFKTSVEHVEKLTNKYGYSIDEKNQLKGSLNFEKKKNQEQSISI